MTQTFDKLKLQEDYENALFRLLMADYTRAEGEALHHENEELRADPNNRPTPVEIWKFQRAVSKAFRNRAAKSAIKSTFYALNRAAAFVVLLFGLFLLSTVAVQAVRVNVLNFLISFEREYTSIQIGGADSNSIIGGNVYVTWTDAYVPTYIPDGFRITRLNNEQDYRYINYSHDDGRTVYYYELSAMYESNIDTEDADRIENVSIHGLDALFVEKDGKLSIAWAGGDRMFVISAQVTENEIFKIAEGVRFISSH